MRLPVLTILLLLLPGFAVAQECPSANNPVVRVTLHQDAPQLYTHVNINGLRNMRGGADIASGGQEHVPLGLAKAEFVYKNQMQIRVSQLRDGSFCVALAQLDLDFSFAKTAIYVASEIPPGSCAFQQVEAHERQHVAVDGQLLREWQFRLQQDAEYAANTLGAVRAADQASAMDELKNRLRDRLTETVDSITRERARRQAEVDTRMEYDRVSRSCRGEVQSLVRRALGY